MATTIRHGIITQKTATPPPPPKRQLPPIPTAQSIQSIQSILSILSTQSTQSNPSSPLTSDLSPRASCPGGNPHRVARPSRSGKIGVGIGIGIGIGIDGNHHSAWNHHAKNVHSTATAQTPASPYPHRQSSTHSGPPTSDLRPLPQDIMPWGNPPCLRLRAVRRKPARPGCCGS